MVLLGRGRLGALRAAAAIVSVVSLSGCLGVSNANFSAWCPEGQTCGVSYEQVSYSYPTNTSVTISAPSVSGSQPSSYSISPNLPGSLSLNPSTGVITGSTGSAASPATTYTITATNSDGSTTTTIMIEITGPSALTVSPTSATLLVNGTKTFSASGGTGPYTYSVISGGGSFSGAIYTAPASSGSATIQVTDSLSNTVTAAITIEPALTISAASPIIATNDSDTFSASGGSGSGYTYSTVSGTAGGSFSGAIYSPGAVGTETVKVTDSQGNNASMTITINSALSISPSSPTIASNDTENFSGSGGSGSGYTFSTVSGTAGGSFSGSIYTPSSSGSEVVKVSDSLGNTATETITVNPLLTISGVGTIAVNDTDTFSASGGSGTGYVFTAVSGTPGGSFSGSVYTPSSTGSENINVTDSLGNSTTTTITVNPALTISPTSPTVTGDGTQTFSASGGVGTYTYSITSGGGVFNGAIYTAPPSAGSATVEVTDSHGNTSSTTVTITSCDSSVGTVSNGSMALTDPSAGIMPLCNGNILIGDYGQKTVTNYAALSGGTVAASYSTSTAPGQLLLDPANNLLYAGAYDPSASAATTLTKVDLGTAIVTNIPVGGPVAFMALGPSGNVFASVITNPGSAWGNVVYVDGPTGTLNSTLITGTYDTLLTFDPTTNTLVTAYWQSSPAWMIRYAFTASPATLTQQEMITSNVGSYASLLISSGPHVAMIVPSGNNSSTPYESYDYSSTDLGLAPFNGIWTASSNSLTGGAFSPDGNYFAVSDASNVYIFTVSTHTLVKTFTPSLCTGGSISQVAFSQGSKVLFAYADCGGPPATSGALYWTAP